MAKRWLIATLSALSFMSLCDGARADFIVSPTGAVIDIGAPGFGNIADTFNQAGLFTGFTSGVTNFDTYLAGNPLHSLLFAGNEWFSNRGTTSATVTYDLGSAMVIDALALWNEDISGIGALNLFTSLDGIIFAPLLSNLLPTNHPIVDYGADVYTFGALSTQYIRFDMSNCPQPNAEAFPSCAIGEVAFRTAGRLVPVPEPATIWIFVAGLLGLGLLSRPKEKRLALS